MITRSRSRLNDLSDTELNAIDPFKARSRLPKDDNLVDYRNQEPPGSPHKNITEAIALLIADNPSSLVAPLVIDNRREIDLHQVVMNNQINGEAIRGAAAGLQFNQVVSIKDALRVIPDFDGHNIPFSHFAEGCNEAKEMIEANAQPNLTKLIRCKISGEARQAIIGQIFDTVDALITFLNITRGSR